MPKFVEIFEDTKEIFDGVIEAAGLNHKINIGVVADNKLKTIGETKKSAPLHQFRTGYDVEIVLNESIFEHLTDDLKIMVAEELICPIHVGLETGNVIISKPDISTYSGFLKKYGNTMYEKLQETIKSIFAKKAEEEQKEKDAKAKIKMNHK